MVDIQALPKTSVLIPNCVIDPFLSPDLTRTASLTDELKKSIFSNIFLYILLLYINIILFLRYMVLKTI